MRLYSFVNMYLSPIQHGIQTAHVVARLFTEYSKAIIIDDENTDILQAERETLLEWANNHETIIVLNAGYSSNLISIHADLMRIDHHYPFSLFSESQEALNSAVTCVGIVLPEKVYKAAKLLKIGPEFELLRRWRERSEDGTLVTIMKLRLDNTGGEIRIGDEMQVLTQADLQIAEIINKYNLA